MRKNLLSEGLVLEQNIYQLLQDVRIATEICLADTMLGSSMIEWWIKCGEATV